MRWWWVNQGQSFARELEHGVVWAGVTDANGTVLEARRAVSDARAGDVIVHYSNKAVRAISVVVADPTVSVWHEVFGEEGNEQGHVASVRYRVLPSEIPRDDLPMSVRLRAAPFDSKGNLRQGYFFPLDPIDVREILEAVPEVWG